MRPTARRLGVNLTCIPTDIQPPPMTALQGAAAPTFPTFYGHGGAMAAFDIPPPPPPAATGVHGATFPTFASHGGATAASTVVGSWQHPRRSLAASSSPSRPKTTPSPTVADIQDSGKTIPWMHNPRPRCEAKPSFASSLKPLD